MLTLGSQKLKCQTLGWLRNSKVKNKIPDFGWLRNSKDKEQKQIQHVKKKNL